MQKNSVKPSSSPRVLSAQWLEHFQRFKDPPSLGGCHRCQKRKVVRCYLSG